MALTHQADGLWHLDIVTRNVEPYLLSFLRNDFSVELDDIITWDTVETFGLKVREAFYARCVTTPYFPDAGELRRFLRTENRTCINCLLGFIVVNADRARWFELFTEAGSTLAYSDLTRVWKLVTGHHAEAGNKKFLAEVFPAKFFMLVMTETSKNEHVNEWKAIFERRLRE